MTAAERSARPGPDWPFGRPARLDATPRADASEPVTGEADGARAAHLRLGGPPGRPIQEADIAQARRFEDLLQSEIAGLRQHADTVQARLSQRTDRDSWEELRRLQIRLDELRNLLGALRNRFPPG